MIDCGPAVAVFVFYTIHRLEIVLTYILAVVLIINLVMTVKSWFTCVTQVAHLGSIQYS